MTAKETSGADGTESIEGAADSSPSFLRSSIVRVRSLSSPRGQRRLSGTIGAALLTVLVVTSLSVLGGLFWFSYKPDRDVDPAAAKSVIAAATDGTVAMLSYSPDTLEHDFSVARSHLTGEFLSYYDSFSKQVVAPAAQQKSVKTSAVVLRSALTEFHPDSAIVLLFINQSTRSKDQPEPTTTSSSVLVTLTKADGTWLISQFNPA